LHLYFNPFLTRRREKEAYLKAIELLRLVHLENQEREYARNLPYGQQRLLEIARGLMAEPDLLLLDEPTAGMNPKEVAVLCSFLEEVRERGFTLFIIEHNMKAIMSLADRIIVLNAGAKIKEGTPSKIQADEEVKEIYLGKEED
jgi:branched-chain amino acid transport system ATP-binding protein